MKLLLGNFSNYGRLEKLNLRSLQLSGGISIFLKFDPNSFFWYMIKINFSTVENHSQRRDTFSNISTFFWVDMSRGIQKLLFTDPLNYTFFKVFKDFKTWMKMTEIYFFSGFRRALIVQTHSITLAEYVVKSFSHFHVLSV